MFVSVTVFKNRAVVRPSSQDNPVFPGPVMLHHDDQFTTYLLFFSHIYGALACDVLSTELKSDDAVIIGSDEEKAKAVNAGFPSAQHLYCALRTKDNLRHHMT